jgi:hypothetical protein
MTVRLPSNREFPANCDEASVCTAIRESGDVVSEGNIKIPMDKDNRMKRNVEDPVAVVMQYRAIIRNVTTILLGLEPEYISSYEYTRKSTFFGQRVKGFFGTCTAYYGVNEAQARGALHHHVVVWGGLPPQLLEAVSHIDVLCKEISQTLDSMFVAHLDRSVHIRRLIEKEMLQVDDGRSKVDRRNLKNFEVSPSPKHQPKLFQE